MTNFQRLLLITIIVLSCVGCDQATKAAAKNYLAPSQPISFSRDLFRLQYTTNTGAFLSIGSTLPAALRFWCLTITTAILATGLLAFVLVSRNLKPAFVIGFSLIAGGGIGNAIDRIFNNGAVIDFMNIGVGSLRTGIFNGADVAIMLGECILVFVVFRKLPVS